MDEDDATLLDAWRAGDRAAGARLLERRVREMTWFFRNKVFNESDVADLVNQTFLACVTAKDRFRGDTSFRRFMYAVAQNTLREYLRQRAKRSREQLDFSEVCVQAIDPRSMSSIHAEREELQAFVHALRLLPLEDQTVLELKYFEGCSGSEIAERLGIPEGTVRSRLRRGLQRLRERIAEQLKGRGEAVPTDAELEAWAAEIRVPRVHA